MELVIATVMKRPFISGCRVPSTSRCVYTSAFTGAIFEVTELVHFPDCCLREAFNNVNTYNPGSVMTDLGTVGPQTAGDDDPVSMMFPL